jgi:hypothetical protein
VTRRPHNVAFADVRALRRLGRRTTIVRSALAAALLALAVVTILLLRDPHVRETRFLPKGTNGIVVLDLSASISTETYSRIGATLTDLVATRGRYGLVIFSDVAYEAFPPGTPAEALRPLIRYFKLPPQTQPGVQPNFPVNPWLQSFSGGTRITTGLEMARAILLDERESNPAVLLISDLDNDLGDSVRLGNLLNTYEEDKLPLHVVALNPDPLDASFFKEFITSGSFLQARLPEEKPRPPERSAELPAWVVAAVLSLIALLAVHELFIARLTWGDPAADEPRTTDVAEPKLKVAA